MTEAKSEDLFKQIRTTFRASDSLVDELLSDRRAEVKANTHGSANLNSSRTL